MKQYQFDAYDDYLEAQKTVTRRKVANPNGRCFTSPLMMDLIAENQSSIALVQHGCCHGVRRGEELQMLEDRLGGHWVGTEVLEELCDGKRVLHHDFTSPKPEWVGLFDVVYSNSLDHSISPLITLRTWLGSLATDTGRLYVEWTPWHDKLGKKHNRADCFAASLTEYNEMLTSVGCVERILVVDEGRYRRHVFVIKSNVDVV